MGLVKVRLAHLASMFKNAVVAMCSDSVMCRVLRLALGIEDGLELHSFRVPVALPMWLLGTTAVLFSCDVCRGHGRGLCVCSLVYYSISQILTINLLSVGRAGPHYHSTTDSTVHSCTDTRH